MTDISVRGHKIEVNNVLPSGNSQLLSCSGNIKSIDTQSFQNDFSFAQKHNFTNTQSPKSNCTSQEYHHKSLTRSSETDLSSLNESSLINTLTPESKHHSLLGKLKLIDNDLPSAADMKHEQLSAKSFKSGQISPSTKSSSAESSDCEESSQHCSDEMPLDYLIKAGKDCEQTLRQIIRTAYQFTRHCRQEKLTLKDLEKALKIHKVDLGSDNSNFLVDKTDKDSLKGKGEAQPITCTGRWLRKPKDTSLNE